MSVVPLEELSKAKVRGSNPGDSRRLSSSSVLVQPMQLVQRLQDRSQDFLGACLT